jgi:hypothetical protein
VLSSHEFRTSKRSQDFLRYAVENTLNGHADLLKERTIGIEVFGRSTSYEPSDDATVRVKAGDVRKRLGLYYAEQGSQNPVRIDLPGGTYVPEFRWEISRPAAPAPQKPAGPVETPAPQISRPRSRWSTIARVFVLVLVGVAVAIWMRMRPAAVIDQFWSPVLNSSSPVSLCVAYVPVFGLDRDSSSTKPLRSEDFVSLTDQFVGGGDLIATSRLSSMLTRMERPYRLRIGNDVSFHDLRTAPATPTRAGRKSAANSGFLSMPRAIRSESPISDIPRNSLCPISLRTATRVKTTPSCRESSIPIRTRCSWNWRASRNTEPMPLPTSSPMRI